MLHGIKAKMTAATGLVAALFLGLLIPSSAQAATAYPYSANGDFAHVTNGEASGHGWWVWDNGGPVRTANVYMTIMKYTGGRWVVMNDASNPNQKPGSGSTVRLNVRFPCSGTAQTLWRTGIVATVNRQSGDTFATTAAKSTQDRLLYCG